MLMPLHDSMPIFMNFRRVLDLLEFKNQVSQCFAGNQQCPGVWNSFPFLAWDLSLHPRAQIWFFNHFICTGECACSSNLNYAHKMAVYKCPNEPRKIPKLNTTLLLFLLTLEIFWKQSEAKDIVLSPKVARSLPNPSRLLWEALVCE